jgi:hypothetical protein
LAVGIEGIDDILADLERGFTAAKDAQALGTPSGSSAVSAS